MEFSFEQNQTVDTLDKVPEDFRGFYVEGEDKKFKLDEKFKKATAAIDGLNKTSKTLRSGEKSLKDLVAGFKALGDTPEEIKQKLEDLNAQLTSKEKINPEKIKEEITKAFEGKLAEKDKKIEGLTGSVRKYLVTSAATAAIAEAKGVPELLMPHIERQVKVVEENGDYKTVVVDAQGETRYGATGSPLTIAELVNSMKADKVYGRAFESDNAGGGGSGGSEGSSQRKVETKKQATEKSPLDKIAEGLAARNKK